ncbi:MAG: hypothetical protein LQ349_006942 [Xanthoria aureola]|nr:MAG: hypothetical protein LQ349_006942 [Xanthoria aureola]
MRQYPKSKKDASKYRIPKREMEEDRRKGPKGLAGSPRAASDQAPHLIGRADGLRKWSRIGAFHPGLSWDIKEIMAGSAVGSPNFARLPMWTGTLSDEAVVQ